MTEIAVLSGKGGTGKTSLSAALATLHPNMVIADCDVDASNLYLVLQPENYVDEKFLTGHKARIDYSTCTNCGKCQSYCRFDAMTYLNGKVTISQTSCDGCGLCARVCTSRSISMIPSEKSRWYAGTFRNGRMIHARLSPGEENSGKLVSLVREKARAIAKEMEWDTIIIDGPPGTGCPVISSVTGTHKAIIVTEPSNSGFHDMKRVIELVRNFNCKPFVVINKCDLNPLLSEKIECWCREQNILVAGKIAFDESVVHAMLHCKSITEWLPNSQASNEIRGIYHTILSS
jgi:MinD superfamily P-loop ATPase